MLVVKPNSSMSIVIDAPSLSIVFTVVPVVFANVRDPLYYGNAVALSSSCTCSTYYLCTETKCEGK